VTPVIEGRAAFRDDALLRVPAGGRACTPRPVALNLMVRLGDNAEPAATILKPEEY
jgi:hypothetical protein